MLLYILYKQKNDKQLNYKYYLLLILKATLIWIAGYGITWLSKWVIYDVIYKEELIKSAIKQVLYRTKGYNRNSGITIQNMLILLLSNNLKYAIGLFNIGIIVLFVKMDKYIIKVKKVLEYIKENIPIFIIALMPLVWYRTLANHTLIHYKFVYRHMLIFLISILICLKNVFIIQKKEKEKN